MAKTVPEPSGWNTWDVQYHTGWVHLPSGLRLRFALRAAQGHVFDGFTWRHGLVRLGHHTVDGGYAAVSVRAHDTELALRVRGGGDELDVLADRDGPADLVLIVDEAPGFGADPAAVRHGVGHLVVHHRDEDWSLECAPAPVADADDPRRLLFPGTAAVAITLRRASSETGTCAAPGATPTAAAGGATPTAAAGGATPTAAAAGATPTAAAAGATPTADAGTVVPRIAHAAARAEAALPRTSGWLGAAGDAMTRALTWNTIYAPDLGRVLTPTSRDFVCRQREGFYGRWALHTWDTFFTGLVAAWVDPAYAEGIFDQILSQAGRGGMLPNRVSDDKGRTDDRSQPPVGAYTVLKAYLGSGLSDQTRRRELLTRAYPVLRDWHAWWASARYGPHGLLAWGSDPVEGDPQAATLDRAKRESGLDDSPMYDDAVLDPTTHTMNLADVGLNALYVADAQALAVIAGILGDDEAEAFTRDAARLARRARELWDADRGRYGNRWADGRFSGHTSPTLLYPLLAGLPDPGAAGALAEALLDPAVLGGDPPLPSTSRNDPGFSTRYWRGRVWAPMAFLAIEGMRRYGLTGHSRPVIDALLRLFLREWTEHSHVRENYPIVPGEDVRPLAARSDGLMGWGGLLGYLAIQELADPRPEGWRFAHPGRPASVEHLALGEGALGVRATDRLTVTLDDRVLLDLPTGAVVTGYRRTSGEVRAVVTVEPGGEHWLSVGVPPAVASGDLAALRVGDAVRTVEADERGLIRLQARGPAAVEFSVQSHRQAAQ
jgi:glycogen debranching enzyme